MTRLVSAALRIYDQASALAAEARAVPFKNKADELLLRELQARCEAHVDTTRALVLDAAQHDRDDAARLTRA